MVYKLDLNKTNNKKWFLSHDTEPPYVNLTQIYPHVILNGKGGGRLANMTVMLYAVVSNKALDLWPMSLTSPASIYETVSANSLSWKEGKLSDPSWSSAHDFTEPRG